MALTTVPASLSATALTLTTAAQPNITSVGTLTGLTVSGNIAGTLTTAAQTNITSLGTLSSLTVSGALNGTLSTAAQTNITSLGTLSALTISGDLTVDTNTLKVDSSNNCVGIGTAPDSDVKVHIKGDGARIYVDSADYNLFSIGRRSSSGAGLDQAYLRMRNAGTNTIVLDTAGDSYFNGGKLLHGTTTLPTGVLLGNQFVSSSATGSEIIAFREDTSVAVGDKTGAFLLGNSDTDGAEDHFVGMYGKVSSTNGSQNLHFVAGRSGYEGDTPDMTILSGGNVGIGTTSPSSYYSKNLVVLTDGDGTGGITLLSPATDDAAYICFADGTSGAARYAGYVGYSHDATENMFIGAGGSTQMTIRSDGKTAIGGNHNPAHSIHVKGPVSSTGGVIAAFDATDSTNAWLQLKNSNSGNSWQIGSTDAGIRFYNDETSGYSNLTIAANGNIGIGTGTTAPTTKLRVISTGSATYSGSSAGSNIALHLGNLESGAAGRTIGMSMASESNAEIYLNCVTASNNNGGDFVIASRNGGTRAEKMRVHAAGSVTKPLQPSFQVRYPGTTALNAGGSGIILVYNSAFHNVGNHYNTSNGRFTAPVDGIYIFHAQIRVDGFGGNYSYLSLEHFSSTGTQQSNKGRDLQDGNNSTYLNHLISQNVYLLANEYVQIRYQNNGDSSVNIDSDSYFSGYLLG